MIYLKYLRKIVNIRINGVNHLFINYARVPKEEGLEKSLHTLTLGREGSNPFLRNIFPSRYFILEIAWSSGLVGIIFPFRLEGYVVLV